MKPKLHPENPHFNQYQQVYESTSVSQQHHQERTRITTEEHSPPRFQIQQQPGNSSDLGNTSQEDYGEYQKKLTAGFEEMCQEMFQIDDNTQPEGAFPGPWGTTEDIGPLPDQLTSITDPRSSMTLEGTGTHKHIVIIACCTWTVH